MTAGEMIRVKLMRVRKALPARRERIGAAGVERASARPSCRTKNLALEDRLAWLDRRFGVRNHRDGSKQRARIGMRGRLEQPPHGARFDESAEIKNAHAAYEIPHETEIVRDEDVREAERPAEVKR